MAKRDTLTAREQQVLALMASGYSNQAIAEELEVTEATVEKHSGNVFHKLGVRTWPRLNPRVVAALRFHGIEVPTHQDEQQRDRSQGNEMPTSRP